MRNPLTGEARERAIEKILSEHPNLTRETLEEWAGQGRPMEDGELAKMMDEPPQGRSKKTISPDPSIPGLVIR